MKMPIDLRGLNYYEPTHASGSTALFLAPETQKFKRRILHVAMLVVFFHAPMNSTHRLKALHRRRNAFINRVSVTWVAFSNIYLAPATSNIVLFLFLS